MVRAAYTAEQIREAEKLLIEAGLPLMQRAAHALAEHCADLLASQGSPDSQGSRPRRVGILAGAGNNGADALYAGAELSLGGARVHAVLTTDRHHEQALQALQEAGGTAEPLEDAESAAQALLEDDLIIDGVLGTGASGPVREPARSLFTTLARALDAAGRNSTPSASATGPAAEGDGGVVVPARPLAVACDVPSGVDPTTGQVHDPTLPVTATVTFGAASTGLLACPRPSRIGRIIECPIGMEHRLPAPALLRMTAADVPRWWPAPGEGDHKYTRGVLGTLVGSEQYPGAGLLCVRAAVNAGAGMVRHLSVERLSTLLAVHVPEAVRTDDVAAHRVQAWAAGSGAADEEQTSQLREILETGLPVIADAAALPVLAARVAEAGPVRPNILMTPHAGELAECLEWLLSLDPGAAERCAAARARWGLDDHEDEKSAPDRAQIEAAPLPWARVAQELFGATVLLKGSCTVVAGPDTAWAHVGGSPWLATAGSGDTLTGLLGAAFALRQARLESGAEEEDPSAWAGTAAAALKVQERVSTAAPGPCPPSVAAERIPAALGALLGTR